MDIIRIAISMILTALILCAEPALAASSDAKSTGHDIILGVKAGYSMFAGYYAGTFRGSYIVGATLAYGNPVSVKYLMGEIDFSFSRYAMKESGNSYFTSYSVNCGPLVNFPVARNFQIYIGAAGQVSYLNLYASKYNRNRTSFKPGALVKAGFFFPIRWGLRVRLGSEYTYQSLSGRPLHSLNFIAGLAYNFNPTERVSDDSDTMESGTRVDLFLSRGDRALRAGNIAEAKSLFTRALGVDPRNREALEKLEEIRKAENDFTRAKKLIEAKQFYVALPLLESSSKLLPEAAAERDRLRRELSGEITALEKSGIESYEKGDYRGCIVTMKRLLQIDPQNRVGVIYLPRAMKRQEALERLR